MAGSVFAYVACLRVLVLGGGLGAGARNIAGSTGVGLSEELAVAAHVAEQAQLHARSQLPRPQQLAYVQKNS